MSHLEDLKRDLSLHPNVGVYIVFETLFASINIMIPILVLRYKECGLSMAEVTGLQAAFAIMLGIFQIPTGYFADKLGRRLSLLVGCALATLSEVTYGVASTFEGFLLAEFIIAAGVSFISGADVALLTDSLKSVDAAHHFARIRARALTAFLIASAVFSGSSGFLAASLGFSTLFFLVACGNIAMFACCLCLREPELAESERGSSLAGGKFWRLFLAELWSNKYVRWVIVTGALISSFNQPSLWFYQPYFGAVGISLESTGLLFALFNLVAALCTNMTPRLEARLGAEKLLGSLILVEASAYLLLSMLLHPICTLLFLGHQAVRGMHGVLVADLINAHTISATRATVNSASSLVGLLLYSLVLLPMGRLADTQGIQVAFLFAGLGVLVLGGLSYFKQPNAET